MIAIAAVTNEIRLREPPLFGLFKALSSRFGGESDDSTEDEIQRLVDRARAGDRLAGQRLYRAYVDRVYRTVRGMLQSDADAEDVTQDTMLTVLTSLNRYSAKPGIRFIAWVTKIAVNTARRRFRRLRREITTSQDLQESPDTSVDLELDADTARRRVVLLQAIAELSPAEREIVSFRYGAELNASEIGEIVNLKPANVRKLLERARTRLRTRIQSVAESVGESQ